MPFVKRHLSAIELEGLIRHEKDRRVLERLIFIRSLYDNETVAKASRKLGRSKVAGYEWLKRWNEGGPEKLKPTFRGGRPAKLSGDKQAKLKQKLKEGGYMHIAKLLVLEELYRQKKGLPTIDEEGAQHGHF
jgi:transposase